MKKYRKLASLLIAVITLATVSNLANQREFKQAEEITILKMSDEIELKKEVVEETEIKPYTFYRGLTREELIEKSNRMLNSTLNGTGEKFVDYSIARDVDPLVAVAIVLQETGCYWSCSSLVNNQYNVGGMMGSNGYQVFSSLDEGITRYIDNIANNYVAYGMRTPEAMHRKYAADPLWASRVNAYIDRIIKA